MADLVRPDPRAGVSTNDSHDASFNPLPFQNCRMFNGPDGYQYRWRPSNNSYNDVVVSVTLA